MKLESDIQARRAELKTLRDSGVRAVQNDCKDQEAAVREAVDAHRKTMAEQALAAGFPKQARNIFWDEYNRDDRTDKPGYKELSRKIDAAYLEEALRTFEKNGHLGDTGGATKACLFSDKPFPRDPGAQVKPIFKTHIESNRVYVMCYLPREASRYVEGESPRFVIHMGMDTGNNFLPVQTVDAGNPQMFGNSRFVHAEFELPPARSDFADVKRYAFDFLCQQKYEFDDRGVKKTRTNKIATAGLFWHR
ncbi:MAG: hypothetical protein KC731_19490 [Myxococcales bacterium]|nr:hypothetical protein [Myxococcales bacterium]